MKSGRNSSPIASQDPLYLDRAIPAFPTRNCQHNEPLAAGVGEKISVEDLRRRLATTHRLAPSSIKFVGDVDEARHKIVRAASGPIVVFPPSTSAETIAAVAGVEILPIARGWGREEVIDAGTAADIPSSALAWVESPADPLGSVAPVADLVRLARSCQTVIVDERLSLFGGQSLLPLAAEFDNVVILRSLAGWPDLAPVWWWAAGSARSLARLEIGESPPRDIEPGRLHAVLTDFDLAAVNVAVRAERSRLYRALRKFSFIRPMPSWAPFIAARIDLVPRDQFIGELVARGIYVHAPAQPGLEQYVRIGVGTRSATDRLLTALREMAPNILD